MVARSFDKRLEGQKDWQCQWESLKAVHKRASTYIWRDKSIYRKEKRINLYLIVVEMVWHDIENFPYPILVLQIYSINRCFMVSTYVSDLFKVYTWHVFLVPGINLHILHGCKIIRHYWPHGWKTWLPTQDLPTLAHKYLGR